MAITYDTLELNISANVKQASSGIRTLTNNLSRLQDFLKGLDFSLIESLQEHLQDIANIDFTNVSKGLQDVVSAFQQVGKEQAKFKSKDFGNVSPINLTNTDGSSSYTFEPSVPSYDFSNAQAFGKSEEQEYNVVIEKNQELTIVAKETAQAMENIKKAVKETGREAGKSAKNGFQKLIGAFKRVLFYRVVRRTLQLIAQAMKEGIQNVALFDANFNQSMSNIITSVKYLKDSLGAVLAPIIQAVEPFITRLLDGLAEVGNKLAEIFSAMSGKDTYTKAIKGAEDYAKSLKKVKDVSLGIDELNVIKTQDEQGGNFETAQVEQNETNTMLGEFGKTLKEVFGGLFDNTKEHLKIVFDIIQALLPSLLKIIEPLLKIIEILDDFVIVALQSIGEVLAVVLPPILDIIGEVLNAIVPIIKVITDILGKVISMTMQVWKTILEPIFNAIKSIVNPIIQLAGGILSWLFNIISKVFDVLQPFLEITQKLYDLVGQLVNNVFNNEGGLEGRWSNGYQVGDIMGSVVDIGKSIISGIGSIFGFATGGFPEDGFFYANHNELVGQFSNGKTAVANNEQIVEGIKRGVYEAMMMSQDGKENQNTPQIAVYLDSREISKTVEKRLNQRANNNITGGYKYGNL